MLKICNLLMKFIRRHIINYLMHGQLQLIIKLIFFFAKRLTSSARCLPRAG